MLCEPLVLPNDTFVGDDEQLTNVAASLKTE
jgi:hypothetical protein